MLVLTRKIGESINIGDDIKIRIMEIKGGAVRLGIEAPKSTAVYREEVYLKIQEENLLASSWQKVDLEKIGVAMKNVGRKK